MERCYFHFLLNKTKHLIEVGPFTLSRLPSDADSTFIRVNRFTHCAHADTLVVKLEYAQTVTYVVQYMGGGFYCFTFARDEPKTAELDGFLKVLCRLADFDQALQVDSFKARLEEHWPALSPSCPVYEGDPLKDAVNSGGLLLEKGFVRVGSAIRGGVQRATNYIESSIENKSTLDLSRAKTLFGTIKSGVGKAIGVTSRLVSAVVDPVISKVRQANYRLCERIDSSDNRTLKYLKEMASTSNNAIQNAFYGLKSAVGDVGSSLSTGTGAILEKKFHTEEAEDPRGLGSSAVLDAADNTNIPLDKEKSSLDILPNDKAHECFGEEALDAIAETPLDHMDTVRSEPREPETPKLSQPEIEDPDPEKSPKRPMSP